MSKEPTGEPKPRDPRALLSAGGLLAAVAAVLVLGAVLHGRVPAPAEVAADVPAPAEPAEPAAQAEPEPPPGLADRARRDRARLSAQGERWTLQLVVACNEDGVQRLLAQAGDDDRLFVLPREVEGRGCWAVTWGSFATRAAALAATPAVRLRLADPPRARPLSGYLP